MEQVKTRTAGNVDVCMNQQGQTLNHTTKKSKTVGANFLPLNHLSRTNPEAQANISNSWEKDIFWMADFATDTEDSTPMWIGWNSNLTPSDTTPKKYGTYHESISRQRHRQLSAKQ